MRWCSQELQGKGHAGKCGDPGRTGEGMTLCLSSPNTRLAPSDRGSPRQGRTTSPHILSTGNFSPWPGGRGRIYKHSGLDLCPPGWWPPWGTRRQGPQLPGHTSSLASQSNKGWMALGTGGRWLRRELESLPRDLFRKAGFDGSSGGNRIPEGERASTECRLRGRKEV